ncbi:MAG TPA: CopG family transcriptional regulator [Chromatiales bacterium]|nr:CopG family transcriptional regulator [Chromatiales bacterium]
MKKEYDFSKGKRGAILRSPGPKTKITIRIDDDILEWFRAQVRKARGGSYQTLMNEALRRFIDSNEDDVEELLRRIVREELAPYVAKKRKR